MAVAIGMEINMTPRRFRFIKYGLIGTALAGATLGGSAVASQSQQSHGSWFGSRWNSSRRNDLAAGTTLSVAFYQEHPNQGSDPVNQLSYTVGESDDLQAMIDFLGASRRARYAVMAVEGIEIDLSEYDLDALRDHLGGVTDLHNHGPFGGLSRRHGTHDLNAGATVVIDFYSGAPDEEAAPVSSVRYVHGEADEGELVNELLSATENASRALVRVEGVVIDLSEYGPSVRGWRPGNR